jgi:hypothetical protein
MHLNALYRAAQAGKQALRDCAEAVTSAAKWNGYAPRALAGKPLKYWHLRTARERLAEAKQQLRIVRDNVSLVAALGNHTQIDSSGGYAIADLLAGGLLESIGEIEIARRFDDTLPALDTLLAQIDELMMRMRKAGAVG